MSLNKFLSVVLVLVMGILMVAGCAAPAAPAPAAAPAAAEATEAPAAEAAATEAPAEAAPAEAGTPIKIGVSICSTTAGSPPCARRWKPTAPPRKAWK